jgi:hypothetical protein
MSRWFPTTTITDVLNQWAQLGVFSYVIPFMLIFAVVFAIIQKTKVLGGENRGVSAIIAASVGLLSLQFDFVSTFFATIFPRVGVGIGIMLALVILLGIFYEGDIKHMKWVGWILGIGAVVWALTNWNFWGDETQVGMWIGDNFWSLIIVTLVILSIYFISRSPEAHEKPAK